ncbi:MAG TPA: ECF-type sigma factor [Blastocatellia bacterium]
MGESLADKPAELQGGARAEIDELVRNAYDELRGLARAYLRRERDSHTLDPTALVNEAYIRLAEQHSFTFLGRPQFFGMAAGIMRNVLVDHARRRRAAKRGGNQFRLSLTLADRLIGRADLDMIDIDDALTRLESLKPEISKIVELRFFAGLSVPDTAEALGVSESTIERGWRFARAWFRHELS